MASKAKGASPKKSTGGKRPRYNTSFNFGANRKPRSGGGGSRGGNGST